MSADQDSSDEVAPPFRVAGKLIDLFPPDHPDTQWLVRLAILRDDLLFELGGLHLTKDSTDDDAWRCGYFLRQISRTLEEVRGVFEFEVGKIIKRERDDFLQADVTAHVREAIEAIKKVKDTFSPIRNSVGGHVRPQDVPGVLRNYPHLEGEALISPRFDKTTFRRITVAAIQFAWPEVDSDAAHDARHNQLRDALGAAVAPALSTIDALLLRHWWNLRLVEVPDGYDLGIRHPETGAMRVVTPPRNR